MKATITSTFTASCCGKSFSSAWQYEAVDWLMRHVRRNHRNLLPRLEKKARKMARSRNGCGYFDGGWINGWDKAQATFREAWRKNALEQMVKEAQHG